MLLHFEKLNYLFITFCTDIGSDINWRLIGNVSIYAM